ncbi:MAG TPA: PQQ-binding-like beta-propeller repeat protein [Vicinamibacterales bacterium]|nr:PQQ-binding-like beta-propeller repeat protein [Vicinamibacterales bacterium]
MRRALWILAAVSIGTVAAGAQQTRPYVPVTDEMLWKPNPADWLMWRRTLDSAGYSPLNQIDKRNVAQLKMTWTRGMGPGNVQEATPLVYNGVMYLPNPSDYVQALDAKSGELLWEYRRKLPEDLGKFMPVFAINRNMAIYGDTVIDTSADDYVFALDVKSGAVRWETKILDYQKGAQQTSGPIIANGKVISGRGCEPEGGADACVVTAHDAKTGKELWRTRTIPRPGEPGAETWGDLPEDKRIHVGTWMVPSYDPQLNLIYIGTSVSSPAPKYALAGNDKKYLYHNSTLALNADTGKIEWYYQHLVDHWDLDHPFERLLIDTAVAPNAKEVLWINPRIKPGEKRQVLTGIPGKTGIVYTLDRKTGEFLWARPTVHQNVVSKIDGTTGAVTENTDVMFTAEGQTRQVCPGMNGGKNWPAGAYSPATGLMYFPLQNLCMEAKSLPPGSSLYDISARGMLAPGVTDAGTVHAISVETGATAWKYSQRAGALSLLATGGGLVFGGDTAGRFRAFDDRTGKVLWEVNLGSPVSGYPVTFAVNGKQYVAVSTGPSLVAGGVNFTTPEIKPSATNQMYVFALP